VDFTTRLAVGVGGAFQAVPRLSGAHAVIAVSGELDLSTSALLQTQFDLTLASHPERIEIDFKQVTFCDCSGLNSLMWSRARTSRLRSAFPSDQHRRSRRGPLLRTGRSRSTVGTRTARSLSPDPPHTSSPAFGRAAKWSARSLSQTLIAWAAITLMTRRLTRSKNNPARPLPTPAQPAHAV
jgi:anti-anti-sigma factor